MAAVLADARQNKGEGISSARAGTDHATGLIAFIFQLHHQFAGDKITLIQDGL
ncbi:MAG TPA: hypothetical protein VMU99_05575 [Acidimicrobiales bacterium]|nr:hypothetical protein [Acidimicrobiales bacterium]